MQYCINKVQQGCGPPYTDPVTYITKCLINVCALSCTLSRKVSEYPQKTEPVTFRAVKTVCVKKIEYMYVSCVQMPDMYIVYNTYILFRPDRLVYMRIFRFFLGQCILRNNLSRLCWKIWPRDQEILQIYRGKLNLRRTLGSKIQMNNFQNLLQYVGIG